MLAKRWLARGASPRRITARTHAGTWSSSGNVGGPSIISAWMAAAVVPVHGGLPNAHSNSTVHSANWSTRAPIGLPSNCSGAM